MNIQKLLKKIDKNSIDNKKQLISIQGPYKLKTCESIGTVNSIADQNERSFVIGDTHTPYNNKNLQAHLMSANSKLDEQLSNIERMKNLYESRQVKYQRKNKSIQKNSGSEKKSLEKHLLKPSNTPSFNKIQKNLAAIEKNQSSACKNLYTQKMLQNSQTSQKLMNDNNYIRVNNIRNNFQLPQSSLNTDHEQVPYEQQPSFNQQSLSNVINVQHQVNSGTSLKKLDKQVFQIPDNYWKSNNLNQTNSFRYESVREKPQSSSFKLENYCSCNCIRREQFANIISNFEAKFQILISRISSLEEDNKKFKQQKNQYANQKIRYQEDLDLLKNEKQRALIQLRKQQQEKKQLQVMLKDVLYKRQRQRLQSSKQNTSRQNERKANNICLLQSQSTSELKQHRNSMGSQSKNSQSKMKVQNLLHKLQIKVDRA